MSYEMEYEPANDCISSRVHGKITAREALKIATEGIKYRKQYPECRRVIVDMRDADMKFTMSDIYYFPRGLMEMSGAERKLMQSFKNAFVVSEEKKIWDFMETFNINLGYSVKIFTDIDKARKWLME